jgi:hypothetical protein
VTALVQGLAPALSDGSRLSWAAPSSLHEGLGLRAMAPDRIQGDAAKPRFDEAQSGIMFACHGSSACFVPNAPASRRARRRQARCAPPPAVTSGQARPRLRPAHPKTALGTKKPPALEQRNRSPPIIRQSPPLDQKPHTRTRVMGFTVPALTVTSQRGVRAESSANRAHAFPVRDGAQRAPARERFLDRGRIRRPRRRRRFRFGAAEARRRRRL